MLEKVQEGKDLGLSHWEEEEGGGGMLWGGRHGSNERQVEFWRTSKWTSHDKGDMRGDLFGIIKRICGSYAEI